MRKQRELCPPELISMDNAMERFMQEYRRNQGLPVNPSGEQGVGGTVEGHGRGTSGFTAQTASNGSSENQASPADPLWYQSHLRAHQADKKFMASAERMKPQKRFSWAGLFALLAVAAVVAWFVWTVAGGF